MRFLFFSLALVLLAGCASEASAPEPAALDLQIVDGRNLMAEIQATDADVTVLNAWATWCAPCIVEFPGYMAYSRRAPDNVAIRFVAVADEEERVRTFLNEQGVTGVSYFIDSNAASQIDAIDPRWDGGIPVTFVFDRDGEIVDAWAGAATEAQLASRVEQALQAQS